MASALQACEPWTSLPMSTFGTQGQTGGWDKPSTAARVGPKRQWMAPDSTNASFRASSFAGNIVAMGSFPSMDAHQGSTEMNLHGCITTQALPSSLDAMAWWNDAEGLVFGDPMEGCLTLLVTRDGGKPGVQTPCDEPSTPGRRGQIRSFQWQHLHRGRHGVVFTRGRHHGAFRSTDRGHSWAVNSLPIRQAAP